MVGPVTKQRNVYRFTDGRDHQMQLEMNNFTATPPRKLLKWSLPTLHRELCCGEYVPRTINTEPFPDTVFILIKTRTFDTNTELMIIHENSIIGLSVHPVQ